MSMSPLDSTKAISKIVLKTSDEVQGRVHGQLLIFTEVNKEIIIHEYVKVDINRTSHVEYLDTIK